MDPEAESIAGEAGDAPVSAPDDGLIGTTLLDSYKVERVLGAGGMGRIYEASHTRIAEKRFAVKVLRPELIANAQIRARFEREMQAVARVNHPGVLSIVDVGTTELGWPYMVCELLSGLDLLAYLRRFGPLPDERVVHMGCRIAEALEATHSHGVIHRDIKPSNVFMLGAFEPLGPEWDRVKLIDFGLSRFVDRDDQLSQTGIVMGTPAYMAPEQAVGGRTDHLTDVYGVGAVLYAAATGVPPFREKTQQETVLAVMSREPQRPRELNPAISEGLELVIQRAMSKQPERRHPSMSALRLALSNLERNARPASSVALVRGVAGGVRGIRWRIALLACAAVFLCLAALASIVTGLVIWLDLDLRLTATERILLVVVIAAVAGLLWTSFQRFRRSTWDDTAKLSDFLPRLRNPVLTAIIVYGLASFALRFSHDVASRFDFGGELPTRLAGPGWGPLLSLLGLLAAAVVVAYQSFWQPLTTRQRWMYGPALAAAVALVAFVFARWELPNRSTKSGRPGIVQPSAGSPPPNDASRASAKLSAAPPAAAQFPSPTAADGGVSHGDLAPAGLQDATDAGASKPSPATQATEPASEAADGVAAERATGTTRGRSPAALALEAKMLAQAERASTMPSALHALEQLLSISPESAADPTIRRVLRRAASGNGDVSRAAFRIMGSGMGSRGPDLLYDLLLYSPSLAERAKYQLSRHRVRKLFSPELAIAYDLRFAPSCGSRLHLLPLANRIGDQRSVNALAELVGKQHNCARRGSPCLAACEREAAQFSRSLDTIVRRLRAEERAARVN